MEHWCCPLVLPTGAASRHALRRAVLRVQPHEGPAPLRGSTSPSTHGTHLVAGQVVAAAQQPEVAIRDEHVRVALHRAYAACVWCDGGVCWRTLVVVATALLSRLITRLLASPRVHAAPRTHMCSPMRQPRRLAQTPQSALPCSGSRLCAWWACCPVWCALSSAAGVKGCWCWRAFDLVNCCRLSQHARASEGARGGVCGVWWCAVLGDVACVWLASGAAGSLSSGALSAGHTSV